MSADMLIAVANAPVYNTPDEDGHVEIVTDRGLLLTRITESAVDTFLELLDSGEIDFESLEGKLDSDEIDLFDEDLDGDIGVVVRRRTLVKRIIEEALTEVFPDGTGDPSREATWLTVGVGNQERTILLTGGMSWGDEPTEIAPALTLLDQLDLFGTPFVRPGSESARTLSSQELYALNDRLTAQLAARGWHAESEADYDALNELTHNVAELQIRIDEMVDAFVGPNSSQG